MYRCLDQPQSAWIHRPFKQWDARSQQHRYDGQLIHIDPVILHQRPNDLCTAADPDVLSLLRLQFIQKGDRRTLSKAVVLTGRQGPMGKDERLPVRIDPLGGRELVCDLVVGPSSHKDRICALHQRLPAAFDPAVSFQPADTAVFIGDVTVQAHRYVQDCLSHAFPPFSLFSIVSQRCRKWKQGIKTTPK